MEIPKYRPSYPDVLQDIDDFIITIKRTEQELLKEFSKEINTSKVIYLENNSKPSANSIFTGNPKVISTNKISEVQTIFE